MWVMLCVISCALAIFHLLLHFNFVNGLRTYVELSQIATEFKAHCGPDAKLTLESFTKLMAKLGIPVTAAKDIYR